MGERDTAIAMRPCLRLAGLLGLSRREDREGVVQVELYGREHDTEWPTPTRGHLHVIVQMDHVFGSTLVHIRKSEGHRCTRVGGELSRIIRDSCRCDTRTEYLLVLSVPESD